MGKLSESLNDVEAKGKAAITTEKILSAISTESKSEFEKVMESTSTSIAAATELVDVTQSIFQKSKHNDHSRSSFSVYKGIVANLMGRRPVDYNGTLWGIMAGDGVSSVTDVILCTDVAATMTLDSVRQRWIDFDLKPMGLATWNPKHMESIDDMLPTLQVLKITNIKALVVALHGGIDPVFWEVTEKDCNTPIFEKFNDSKKESGRKKTEKYRVVDVACLGKSNATNISDTMKALQANALKNSIASSCARLSSDSTIEMEMHTIPADGYCFWHCIHASGNFQSWHVVPRQSSGYAINKRMLLSEESLAKETANTVIQKAMDMNAGNHRIQDMLAGKGVDLSDLHWISDAAGLAIRCTVSDEAGA